MLLAVRVKALSPVCRIFVLFITSIIFRENKRGMFYATYIIFNRDSSLSLMGKECGGKSLTYKLIQSWGKKGSLRFGLPASTPMLQSRVKSVFLISYLLVQYSPSFLYFFL